MLNRPFGKDLQLGSRQANRLPGLFLLALAGASVLLLFLLATAYRESGEQAEISARNTAVLLVLGQGGLLARLLRVDREEWATAARLAESEARYRLLAENSHDAIWMLDIPTRRNRTRTAA